MKTVVKAVLDPIIAIGFLLLLEPKLGPLSWHEWGGLAICLLFVVHKCLNWAWIKSVTTKLFSPKLSGRLRLNYILDLVLLIAFALIALSGMGIAKTIDFTWLFPGELNPFWRGIHGFASLLVLAVVGVHVGLHWDWIRARIGTLKTKELVDEKK
ncbi:MAG TPA: DUF4405 domain-containing protein [Rectinemataceae bacterium]|nr:DUF4405 domain-containing protein [Rectinemataceae bacterium]